MLARLHDWLNDEASKARLLLVAPAGRGKSAVLVQWARALQQAQSRCEQPAGRAWHLVFVPVSNRFGLNQPRVFYEAIAARLGEILHIVPDVTDAEHPAFYEDLCRQLLDGAVARQIPILLIIDGIDEALGDSFSASWFPRCPGRQLRLVVSARFLVGDADARGWLTRLGWHGKSTAEAFVLEPLTPAEIADSLRTTRPSLAAFASRPSVILKLYALTAGEPLVLSLYISDLLSIECDALESGAEFLDNLKPGLGGYFHDWLSREQKVWQQERAAGAVIDESTLRVCLSVLACAHGPLTAFEVEEVAKKLGTSLRSLRVEDALRPLRRFVIGTGRSRSGTEGGFVLSHPKFASFLRDEYLDRHQIVETRQAFASWGAEALKKLRCGELAISAVPSYLINYLGEHFEDADAPADVFMDFVEKNWVAASEYSTASYQSAADDIKRALVVVSQAATRSRPAQIRCKLFLQSVRSRWNRTNVELAALCFSDGLVGVRYVLDILACSANQDDRVEIVRLCGPLIPEDLLSEVLLGIRALDTTRKIEALTEICGHLPERVRDALLAESIDLADEISNDEDFANAFLRIANVQSGECRQESYEKALARVDLFSDSSYRYITLLAPLLSERDLRGYFAKYLWHSHRFVNRDILRLIPYARYYDTLKVRAYFCRFLKPEEQARTISKIGAYLKEPEHSGDIKVLFGNLGPALTPDCCRDVLNALRKKNERVTIGALVAIARQLPVDERRWILDLARNIDARLGDEGELAKFLAHLADFIAEPHRTRVLEDALRLCRKCLSPDGRCLAYAELITRVASVNRSSLVEEWISTVKEVKDIWARRKAVGEVAPHVPEPLRAAVLLEDEANFAGHKWLYTPSYEQLLLARALSESAKRAIVEEAREDILAIPHYFVRTLIYPELMRALDPENQMQLLPKVLEDMRGKDGVTRISALMDVAQYSCEAVQSELVSEALREIDKLPANDECRATNCAYVARFAPGPMQNTLVRRALQEARGVGQPDVLAQCLSQLAAFLATEGDIASLDELLHCDGQIGRRVIVSVLTDFLPLIARVETPEALIELHRAVVEASECFP